MASSISSANNLVAAGSFSGAQSSQGSVNSCQAAPAIPGLPDLVTLCIFEFLNFKELGRVALVSHDFQRLSSDEELWSRFDLNRLFPFPRNIIDRTVWESYVDVEVFELDLGDLQPFEQLSRRTQISILCPFTKLPIEKIQGMNPGVTILTVPAGLTLNKLGNIAQNPKSGHCTCFGYLWDRITKEYGDKAVDKTYRVVIANNILQGTRNKSYAKQSAFVTKLGCRMPTLVEAITLVFLTYISSTAVTPVCLFGSNPHTYTRVLEKSSDPSYTFDIGSFALSGLKACNVYSYFRVHDSCGMGAVRKF